MASPAKKRKTNSHVASPQKVRSLDYFFGKQKRDNNSKTEGGIVSGHKDSAELLRSLESLTEFEKDGSLTDEQLAQKLQDDWNKESDQPKLSQTLAVNELQPRSEGEAHAADQSRLGETAKESTDVAVTDSWRDAAVALGPPTTKTLSLQSNGAAEDSVASSIPFDESPFAFDPSKYVKDLQKHWETESGDASYALLTRCFVLVNSTQSRIKIVDTLVNLLRIIIEADPDSLLPAVRPITCSNQSTVNRSLGVAGY